MAASVLRLSKCQWSEGQERGSQEGAPFLIKGPHVLRYWTRLSSRVNVLDPEVFVRLNKHPEPALEGSFSVFSP